MSNKFRFMNYYSPKTSMEFENHVFEKDIDLAFTSIFGVPSWFSEFVFVI